MNWQAILGVLGLGLAYYFQKQATKNGADNKLDKTRSVDEVLKEQQDELNAQIKAIADGILKMKQKKEESKPDQTPEQRAEDWNKK